MPRMANWDTELGYQLYCEGKSDGEIADACRAKISTVTSYRLKRWRKNLDGGRDTPLAGNSGISSRRLPRPLRGLAMTRKI